MSWVKLSGEVRDQRTRLRQSEEDAAARYLRKPGGAGSAPAAEEVGIRVTEGDGFPAISPDHIVSIHFSEDASPPQLFIAHRDQTHYTAMQFLTNDTGEVTE